MLSHKKLDELTIVSFTGTGYCSSASKTTSFLVETGSKTHKALLEADYYYYGLDGKHSEVIASVWISKATDDKILIMEEELKKGLNSDFIYDYIDEKDYPGGEGDDVYPNFVNKVIDEAKKDTPFVVCGEFKIKKELLEEFETLLDRFIYKGEK